MDEEQKEKQEQEQAGQKTAHVAGKAASSVFGGALGKQAYNIASQTKTVQAMENMAGKALNLVPGAKYATNALNKSGALDAADKGIDAVGGKSGGLEKETLAKEKLQREGLEEKAKQDVKKKKQLEKQGDNSTDGEEKDSDASGEEQGDGGSKKNKWLILSSIPALGCGGCAGILIIGIVLIVLAPAMGVINFFEGNSGDGEGVGSSEIKEAEDHYKQRLAEAQRNAYSKYRVCVDVNLIHATLTADKAFDDELEEGEEPCEDLESCSEQAADSLTVADYKKMEKYIDLLVNMQIKRKKYGLYKRGNPGCYQSSYGDICAEGGEPREVIVTDENQAKECMDTSLWNDWFSDIPLRNSENPRLVARNDKETRIFNFLTKKANREKNYAYYYYIPGATFVDNDKDGIKETRICRPTLPISYNDFAELNVADWNTMEEGIYFWNLLDSFVEDYYDDYLIKGPDYAEPGSKRYQDAADIIDKIYSLYDTMGPSRDCSELYSYQTVSNFCPDGVTVVGKDAGTYDLEEYIAGVVEAEMYADFPMESKRALAVAARSYVISSTNQCQQAIDNSSHAQNFNPNYSEESWQAANSTRGEVITSDGKVILAQYDSWNCPGRVTCEYKKLPSEETHIVTISNTYLSRAAGGHGRGMSQIAAADMAKDGSSYRDILSYFYTGTISVGTGGSGETVKNGNVSEKLAFLFPDGIPTSSIEMQKYLTTVTVPLFDINGNSRIGRLTVHQAVANDVVNAFTEIARSGFPIKDVYCYSWRGMAGNSQTTSHHSYGVACDINANENYMIRNGSVIAGSLWRPGENPYSIVPNGPVVQAFEKYGWTWGGSWSSSKDYMHFSFTGY